MPANLTLQYQKAEEEFRQAQTSQERLEGLERMLQLIPKHKGTEKLQADLKSRLKELRLEQQAERLAPKGGKVYRFARQGAGRIVIIGAPNAGKSRILKELTRAEPEVAEYPFTTREPLPGMMTWEDVVVQLIDTPPIVDGQLEPYLLNLVRTSDLVLLAFDGGSDDAPEQTLTVLTQLQQRKTRLSPATSFDEQDFSILRIRTLLVATRAADPECAGRLDFFQATIKSPLPATTVEFDDPPQIEGLKRQVFGALQLVRIYTRPPGRAAEDPAPITLPVSATVEDLALKVHRDLSDRLKFARIWRGAAEPQNVGRDYVLADRDLVELHT